MIALAVPVIFPVPTRPPMAMARAWKGVSPELALLFLKEQLSICLNSLICGNFKVIENRRPQPKEKMTRIGPHAKLSTAVIISLTVIIFLHFSRIFSARKGAILPWGVEKLLQIVYNIKIFLKLYGAWNMTCHIAI